MCISVLRCRAAYDCIQYLINWSRDRADVEGRPATRERMPVKPPPLINSESQSTSRNYTPVEPQTCAIARKKMADYEDLNRLRMARRKQRGESPFLTLPRINKSRDQRRKYAKWALDVVPVLGLVFWPDRKHFGTRSKQTEMHDETPLQPVELPAQPKS
jgi:hypothetical protein